MYLFYKTKLVDSTYTRRLLEKIISCMSGDIQSIFNTKYSKPITYWPRKVYMKLESWSYSLYGKIRLHLNRIHAQCTVICYDALIYTTAIETVRQYDIQLTSIFKA